MGDRKKAREIWNTDPFLQNIFEGILKRTENGWPYDGTIFYGVSDVGLLESLREDLEFKFKDDSLDCYVFAFRELPENMAVHNRDNFNGGDYHLVDVGCCIDYGILKRNKVTHIPDQST